MVVNDIVYILPIIGYFHGYVTILFFCIFSFIIAIILYFLSISVSAPLIELDIEKFSSYECGFVPFNDARLKFDVNFYIISLLFVIFDLEIVFLFPWAACFYQLGFLGLVSMFLFFFILIIGFIFEWSKGALEI